MKREVPDVVPFETAVSVLWDLCTTKGHRAIGLLGLLGDSPVGFRTLQKAVDLEPNQVRTFLMWGEKVPLEAVDLDAVAAALGDIERECSEGGYAPSARYSSWAGVLFAALSRVLPVPRYDRDLALALDVALENRVQPGLALVLFDLWAREEKTVPVAWDLSFVADLAEAHNVAPGVVQDLMRRRGWWFEPAETCTVRNVSMRRFHVTVENTDSLPDTDA